MEGPLMTQQRFYFLSAQANRITEAMYETYCITPDFPWSKASASYGVFRHQTTRKWFALIMDLRRRIVDGSDSTEFVNVINLKIHPEDGEALRSLPGVYPAYHMNRYHWISVILDDNLTDNEVLEMIETSYLLTKKK